MKAKRKKKVRKLVGVYLKCAKRLHSIGSNVTIPKGHHSLYESFAAFDDNGKIVPCRNQKAVNMALCGKASLGAQIVEWAGCLRDIPSPAYWFGHIAELREDFPWLPEWVWKAVISRAGSKDKIVTRSEKRLQEPISYTEK